MSRYFFIEFKEFDKENIEKIVNWLNFHSERKFPYCVDYEKKQIEFVRSDRSWFITTYLKPSMFLKYDKLLDRVNAIKKEDYLNWIWKKG